MNQAYFLVTHEYRNQGNQSLSRLEAARGQSKTILHGFAILIGTTFGEYSQAEMPTYPMQSQTVKAHQLNGPGFMSAMYCAYIFDDHRQIP